MKSLLSFKDISNSSEGRYFQNPLFEISISLLELLEAVPSALNTLFKYDYKVILLNCGGFLCLLLLCNSVANACRRNSWLYDKLWSKTKFARHFVEFSRQVLFGFIQNFADQFIGKVIESRNFEELFRDISSFIIHANTMFVKVNYIITKNIDFPAMIQSVAELPR